MTAWDVVCPACGRTTRTRAADVYCVCGHFLGDPPRPPRASQELDPAKVAMGDRVRDMKRQIEAKNAKRSADADARAARVRRLAAQGLTADEIAERLEIEPRTVRRLKNRS